MNRRLLVSCSPLMHGFVKWYICRLKPVKAKLFKRDFLKRKAIKTIIKRQTGCFHPEMLQTLPCVIVKRSIILRNLVTINRIRKKPGEL